MLNNPMFSQEVQWVLLLALVAVIGFLLITIAVLVRRVRKRREDKQALAHRMEVAFREEYDERTQDSLERTFGRRALWRREVAQRELDRFNGKRADKATDPDPTFAEWCAARGFDEVTA